MKKFLLQLCFFLLPFVITFVVVDLKISSIPSNFRNKKTLLEKKLNDIEVLVTGSSHALHGIDPSRFSVTGYNIANPDQTLYFDIRITKKYLDQMPKLKLVIIPIDYFSLKMQMHGGPEEWREYIYLRYWGIKYKDFSYLDVPKNILNLFKLNSKIESNANAKSLYLLNEFGYTSIDSSGHLNNISPASGKEHASFLNSMMHNNKESVYIYNDLDNFVKTLINRNIKVVFLTSPVFRTFSDYTDPSVLSYNRDAVNKLCLKYNCKYFNYFSDRRFTVDDFADNVHLDDVGAMKWSKIIDSEIVRPALSSNK